MQLGITSTTSSTETGSGLYPLLQALCNCGISDPVGMVLSHVMRGHPHCLLQSSGERVDKILLTYALSSTCAMCWKWVRRRDWTNWCHLIPNSIRRHQSFLNGHHSHPRPQPLPRFSGPTSTSGSLKLQTHFFTEQYTHSKKTYAKRQERRSLV